MSSFVDSPDTYSNYWLNAVILKDKEAQIDFLTQTNDNGVMTRPIWELMNRLPMFENCENDGLKNTIYFADRVVNIPSSVRPSDLSKGIMNKPLILIGGGGHCKSVIEAAESAGYSILGILDMPEDVGNEVLPGYKVIGTDDDIPTYVDQVEFVITVGFIMNPIIRIKIFNKVKEAGGKLATVVASTALVSKYATIGEGTVVLHHAFVNASAKSRQECYH